MEISSSHHADLQDAILHLVGILYGVLVLGISWLKHENKVQDIRICLCPRRVRVQCVPWSHVAIHVIQPDIKPKPGSDMKIESDADAYGWAAFSLEKFPHNPKAIVSLRMENAYMSHRGNGYQKFVMQDIPGYPSWVD